LYRYSLTLNKSPAGASTSAPIRDFTGSISRSGDEEFPRY
jgi:hypothetical protein